MENMKKKIWIVEHGERRNLSGATLGKQANPLTEGAIQICFHGTRGSLPAPGPNTIGYGGNTACVSVECGKNLIILDSGSGIREYGSRLNGDMGRYGNKGLVLISHVHWDHIQGFPFFGPFYDAKNEFTICGPKSVNYKLETVLKGQMQPPNFPIRLADLPAKINFRELQPRTYHFGDITVKAARTQHPQTVAFSYRINYCGKTIVYATDTEHYRNELDADMVKQAKDADVLIYDAQYTPEEYPSRISWGHSTWEEGVKLAKAVNAKMLVLFHHDPTSSDAKIQRIEESTRKEFPASVAAKEGMGICIDDEQCTE